MMTLHAYDRASNRLLAAGLSRADVADILEQAQAFASKCGPYESVALRMRTLSAFVGRAWSAESNGDMVVAIIRYRDVQTFMLRRSSQPFHPANLNVDRCVTL